MFASIIEVKVLPDFHLWLKFADGTSGDADIKRIIKFRGVFESLLDPQEFAKVAIDREWGNIYWQNGTDLDTEVLYSLVTGKPITLNDGTAIHCNFEAPSHV